jgi:hypothetical protein
MILSLTETTTVSIFLRSRIENFYFLNEIK